MQIWSADNMNKSQRQPSFGFTLSVLGTFVVFSIIWCETEGRGNRVRADSSGTKSQICKSRECIDAANVIFANRDTSVEPCDNFYQFACGGWIKSHPVPENKTTWDQFREASAVTNGRLREILEKEDAIDDLQSIKDARKFYRVCLDIDKQAKRNMEILLERLAVWGGWPIASKRWKEEMFDWKKFLVHLIRTNHASPLLQIIVGTDRHNTSQNVLIIDQAEVGCGFLLSENRISAMKSFLRGATHLIAKATNQTISEKRILSDVRDIMRFQMKLCQALSATADREDDFRLYNVKTIAELQNMTDRAEPLKEDSKINWLTLLNDFLEGADVKIDENQKVIVQEPDFVVSLIHNVDKVSRRTLANFLLWQKILMMHETVSPKLRKLGYDYEESVTGANGVVPRWETCVTETNTCFSHAVGYEYVKLHFDADAKKNAEELVSNILESFIEELKEIDWMDGETRKLAIEKANNLVPLVAYPNWYEDASNVANYYSEYEIGSSHLLNVENIGVRMSIQTAESLFEGNDRESWISQIAVVNAFYSVDMNAISIPAGIFQPPFYVKGRPEALNYGAVGAVIGHEISHAFDVSGRMADKFGNLAQWWSADTLKTYLIKKGCIEKQYNDYPVPELLEEADELLSEQLDGIGTVSENIADNGGLQESFAAYRRYLHQHATEPRLPGLVHYSPQQLFYIGYASVWCENGNQQSLVNDILMDTHSPSKYRVLIPLGNSKEFADTWKCRQNDFKMNPVQKCEFW